MCERSDPALIVKTRLGPLLWRNETLRDEIGVRVEFAIKEVGDHDKTVDCASWLQDARTVPPADLW